jgi:RNA polymerase sigma-70 factor (ECF subfamily)
VQDGEGQHRDGEAAAGAHDHLDVVLAEEALRAQGVARGGDDVPGAGAAQVLDGLPGEQREALLLAYGRGLTAQEIAQATEIPLGTAKSRVRLGLRKARATLQAAA